MDSNTATNDTQSPSSPSSSSSSSSPTSSISPLKTFLADKEEMMKKFKELHQKRQEARKLNYEQVVEEDRRNKLPNNYELKRKRQEWELEQIEKKKIAEERGEDYERLVALETQADVADRKEIFKRRKNPDRGFGDYESMTLRQYQRLSGNIQPDVKSYEKMREVLGPDQFYATANTLISGSHYPTDAALNKLSDDIKAQARKREQYHRRRMFDPDAPIDYISERNRKFNQKLDRFYDKYTEDLKGDLERGTAI